MKVSDGEKQGKFCAALMRLQRKYQSCSIREPVSVNRNAEAWIKGTYVRKKIPQLYVEKSCHPVCPTDSSSHFCPKMNGYGANESNIFFCKGNLVLFILSGLVCCT